MEAKLCVIIDDQIKKLVLPSGIPATVQELQSVVKDIFGISEDFSLQYFDSEFEDSFTLHRNDQIKHKVTVKVVCVTPVVLNLAPLDESFGSPSGQLSTDCDSYVESVVSSLVQQHLLRTPFFSVGKRPQPWPKQFPIPQFAYETEMYLELTFTATHLWFSCFNCFISAYFGYKQTTYRNTDIAV